MQDARIQPGSWLIELARIRPAKWKWNRAIRAAICIGLPLAVGMLIGNLSLGVWMSIASLMVVGGEGNGSYRSRFRLLAVCTSVGALGCLVGYIDFLPWAWIVLIMGVLAFIGGIVSSYSAALSLGSLQFFVLAAVAVGHPQIAPFWGAMLYYIAGVAFYAFVLGIEALLAKASPQQKMLANLLDALGALAEQRAGLLEQDPSATAAKAETCSQAVTGQMAALYSEALGSPSRRAGRSPEADALLSTLRECDTAFAQILAETSAQTLHAAAASLHGTAAAIRSGSTATQSAPQPAHPLQQSQSAQQQAGSLERTVAAIAANQPSGSAHASIAAATQSDQPSADHSRGRLALLLERLIPSRPTMQSSLVLAVCTALAYAAHWFDKEYRWYWVPLTIAIVVKPDYGSLFARSLLRSVGVLVGAVVGSAILILIPKGIFLAIPIALCAAFIPWASQRSYAVLGVAITPLILVLIDLTVPGPVSINYAGQRVLGTIIAAGIVLVFGYFIWPRAKEQKIANSFRQACRLIADYLLAATGQRTQTPQTAEAAEAQEFKSRRQAYAKLTDMRGRLQKLMADPPPASSEAAAWLPIVASAQRICDQISVYAAKKSGSAALTGASTSSSAHAAAGAPAQQQSQEQTLQQSQEQITRLADAIAQAAEDAPAQPAAPVQHTGSQQESELIEGIGHELDYISRLTHNP